MNVDFEDGRRARAGGKRLVLDADIGFGEVTVRHTRDFEREFGRDFGEDLDQPAGNRACVGGDA